MSEVSQALVVLADHTITRKEFSTNTKEMKSSTIKM
jgi:hypothetical protein